MALSKDAKNGILIGCGVLSSYEAITHITTTIELGSIAVIGYTAFHIFGSEKNKLVFNDMVRRAKESIKN